MRVLITGGSGQLGAALQDTAPPDYAIEAIDRSDLDLTDEVAVQEWILADRPDLVINAAAYSAVDKAETDERLARKVNADAVWAMSLALASTGGKLVQMSTDFVFDGCSFTAYRPADRPNPLSVYGRTKAEGEVAAGSKALIVRTSWLYSAGHPNFVRTMLDLMRSREELGIVADQVGAPTWAPGLARAIWGLVREGAHGIWHHSDAGIASWYDFAVAIQKEAIALGMINRCIPITPIASADYPTAARRPAFSLLDCRETRALLDDDYTHWRENLRIMLEEEKALG